MCMCNVCMCNVCMCVLASDCDYACTHLAHCKYWDAGMEATCTVCLMKMHPHV